MIGKHSVEGFFYNKEIDNRDKEKTLKFVHCKYEYMFGFNIFLI